MIIVRGLDILIPTLRLLQILGGVALKSENLIETCKKIESSFDLPFYIYSKIRSKSNEKVIAPLKIGLNISNECHFRCPYCFVSKNSEYLRYQD